VLKLAIPLGVLLAIGAAPADAQSLGQAIQGRFNSTATLLNQQGHPDTMPAATGRARAKAETAKTVKQVSSTRRSPAFSAPPFAVPADHDSLAGMNAATYRLGNGVVLQVTGLFQPDAPTVCVAYCS